MHYVSIFFNNLHSYGFPHHITAYEFLFDDVSTSMEQVANWLAIIIEMGGQICCLDSLYISCNGTKCCHLCVELTCLVQVITKYLV